ncbi:MAG: hypothetical protein H6592_11835 [Flavobacteriales bacterium]|nr:hypothetical protein [Flavobacteriales bacterium]
MIGIAIEVLNELGHGLLEKPYENAIRGIQALRHSFEQQPSMIGVGGIDSAESAIEKLEAGADLVQVYTGLVYEGPALLTRINEAYLRWKQRK